MGLFYPIKLPPIYQKIFHIPTDDYEATIHLLHLPSMLRLAVGLSLFDQAEQSILKVIS